MRKVLYQIFAFILLAGLSAYASEVAENSTSKPSKENEMITAKKMSRGLIPPIDAAVPPGTRTVTFALG